MKIKKMLIEHWASNAAINCDNGHDLGLLFSKSNIGFPISQEKMFRLSQDRKRTYRLNAGPQM